jgi:glycosyltransferase involved in cell wall biosynthesis
MKTSTASWASSIPAIASMPDGPGRPFFSVMIPTYESDELLEQTLRSVLNQDPGPDRMQIAIVDDCSTSHRHSDIVRRLAPARVEVYRQGTNLGLADNWNSCIAHSRGRWVHILHQDDFVLAGFYDRLARADAWPEVGAAFCRPVIVDENELNLTVMDLEHPTAGILPDWLRTISQRQHIQCASVVVRRSVYEQIGGFRRDLRYALDWEMWVRIAATYSVWYEPEPLARYRVCAGTESTRLEQTGRDIADVRRAISIVTGYLPHELKSAAGRAMLEAFRSNEMRLATEAFRARDLGTGLTRLHRAFGWDPALRYSRTAIAYYRWALKIWLGDRLSARSHVDQDELIRPDS